MTKSLGLRYHTFLFGYADNMAAVIRARKPNQGQGKIRQMMTRTRVCLNDHYLELVPQKTELLHLTRRHIPKEIEISEEKVMTQKSIIRVA